MKNLDHPRVLLLAMVLNVALLAPGVDLAADDAPAPAPAAAATPGSTPAPGTGTAPAAAASPPSAPASSTTGAPSTVPTSDSGSASGACSAANLRIVGPRTKDRPLPLMSGDGAHGFKPACRVPWAVLSPHHEPLSVEACYRDSLLQIANDTACGGSKAKLWVSARWVITSAGPASENAKVVCQQLETGAYAGTRALKPSCVPGNPTPASATVTH
jgi:hypothetical protein